MLGILNLSKDLVLFKASSDTKAESSRLSEWTTSDMGLPFSHASSGQGRWREEAEECND